MLNLSASEIDTLYAQLLEALDSVTILVKFIKVNGESRVLLGTRNKRTVQEICHTDLSGKLAGFDKKANIGNHNIPIVDLALGDVRTFCVERLEAYQVLGVVNSTNSEAAFEYYNQILDNLEKEINDKADKAKETGSLIDLV
jgi:hypothetical protein